MHTAPPTVTIGVPVLNGAHFLIGHFALSPLRRTASSKSSSRTMALLTRRARSSNAMPATTSGRCTA